VDERGSSVLLCVSALAGGFDKSRGSYHHRQDQSSESGSVQNRRGRGGGHVVHAGQKRKVRETNGSADDDYGTGTVGQAATKRYKSECPYQVPLRGHIQTFGILTVLSLSRSRRQKNFRLHQSMLQKHSGYFAAVFREGKGKKHQRSDIHRSQNQ
jgi:hypothetical protein